MTPGKMDGGDWAEDAAGVKQTLEVELLQPAVGYGSGGSNQYYFGQGTQNSEEVFLVEKVW